MRPAFIVLSSEFGSLPSPFLGGVLCEPSPARPASAVRTAGTARPAWRARPAASGRRRVLARSLAAALALTVLLSPATIWGAMSDEPAPAPVLGRVNQAEPSGTADADARSSAPFLLVLSPADGDRVGASQVEVTGRTNPGRAVLVLNEEALYEAAVDDSGAWSIWVDLSPGDNDLVVLSVDPLDASAPILDEDILVFCAPFARV